GQVRRVRRDGCIPRQGGREEDGDYENQALCPISMAVLHGTISRLHLYPTEWKTIVLAVRTIVLILDEVSFLFIYSASAGAFSQ
ncbi:MAG: hypothetical protein K8F29_04050, partial [Kofleriaceae bacterium]|nr:hypothetical protein [Candidatus Methylomirabilis lanthanidiphila]